MSPALDTLAGRTLWNWNKTISFQRYFTRPHILKLNWNKNTETVWNSYWDCFSLVTIIYSPKGRVRTKSNLLCAVLIRTNSAIDSLFFTLQETQTSRKKRATLRTVWQNRHITERRWHVIYRALQERRAVKKNLIGRTFAGLIFNGLFESSDVFERHEKQDYDVLLVAYRRHV